MLCFFLPRILFYKRHFFNAQNLVGNTSIPIKISIRFCPLLGDKFELTINLTRVTSLAQFVVTMTLVKMFVKMVLPIVYCPSSTVYRLSSRIHRLGFSTCPHTEIKEEFVNEDRSTTQCTVLREQLLSGINWHIVGLKALYIKILISILSYTLP